MKTDKYVGLDVHKDTTVIALAEGGREGEVRVYGTIASDLHALEKVLRKLSGPAVTLRVVYGREKGVGPHLAPWRRARLVSLAR